MTLAPAGDNLFAWTASIPGPEGSCYEGGLFHIDISLAHDYPCVHYATLAYRRSNVAICRFSAPKMAFRTRYGPFQREPGFA